MPAAAPKSRHQTGKPRQGQAGFTQGRPASLVSLGGLEKLGATRPPGLPGAAPHPCVSWRGKRGPPGLPPSPSRRGGAGRAASLPFRASVSRAPSLLPALRSAHTDLGTSAAAPKRSRRHCHPGSCGGRAALGAGPRARRTRRRFCCCRRSRGLAGRRTRGGRAGGRAGPGGRVSSSCSCVGRAALSASPAPPSWDNADVGAAQARGARGGRAGRREGGKEGGPVVSRRAARAGARRGGGGALPTAVNHRELSGRAFRPCALAAAPGGREEPRRRLRIRAGEAGAAMLEEGGAGRERRPGGRARRGGARGCACARVGRDPRAGRCQGGGYWMLGTAVHLPIHTRASAYIYRYAHTHTHIGIHKHIQIQTRTHGCTRTQIMICVC